MNESTDQRAKAYIESQNALLHTGDVVRIVAKAKSHEHGWQNTWVSEMDAFVGNSVEYEVLDLFGGSGVRLGMAKPDYFWGWPYFVLEKKMPDGSWLPLGPPGGAVCNCLDLEKPDGFLTDDEVPLGQMWATKE